MSETKELSLIDRPGTAERFAKIFAAVHGVDLARAAQMFEVERFGFLRELSEKGVGGDCTEVSKMGVFLDVISNGLSFSGQLKHVYMMTRNVKDGKGGFQKRLVYSTSPDGKTFLAQKAGSIDRVTKPIMVYEGDDFGIGTKENGEPVVIHKPKIPRTSNKLIAGYVYIVFPDGAREPYWMDMADMDRLKKYSAKNNRGEANALYSAGESGQPDAGFFGAKLINFALKNIRRAGLTGQFEVEDIDYVDTPTAEFTPDKESEFQPDVEPESF
jgi:RecT family